MNDKQRREKVKKQLSQLREVNRRRRKEEIDAWKLAIQEKKFEGKVLEPAIARRHFVPEPNAKCSCGSGKKYKKCCGDPAKKKIA